MCVSSCRNFQTHDNKVLHVPLVKFTQVLLPKHCSCSTQTQPCRHSVHKCWFKRHFMILTVNFCTESGVFAQHENVLKKSFSKNHLQLLKQCNLLKCVKICSRHERQFFLPSLSSEAQTATASVKEPNNVQLH